LQIAVWKNQFSLAKDAIKTSSINAINDPGLSALHIATQGGYLKWISFLISQGADCNIPDFHGQIPLHFAAFQGDLNAVKLLYNSSDALRLTNSGTSALLLAIKSGKLDVIEYFLEKNGIDIYQDELIINDRDNNQNGFLYYAVTSNCAETLALLLSKALSEEIFHINTNGANLLHAAAAHGSPLIYNILLSHGLDPSLTDEAGQTLLHYAVKYNNCKMVEFLLHKGFTWMLQSKTVNGVTPLHYASAYLSPELFPTLLSLSIDIDAPDKNGNTPLFYAVKSERIQNTLWLLKTGADIYTFNNDGLTPIHVAATSSFPEIIISALLSQVDVIDLLDAYGNTPLQTALTHTNFQAALYLIPWNSITMLFHENAAGLSAIDMAKMLRNRDILDEINKLLSPPLKKEIQLTD
jgi:ankyrin repeat protein